MQELKVALTQLLLHRERTQQLCFPMRHKCLPSRLTVCLSHDANYFSLPSQRVGLRCGYVNLSISLYLSYLCLPFAHKGARKSCLL